MENGNNPLICFFDSGIGGLNLLYECVRRLPRVDFTYFADNFHVPYGNMSRDELIKTVDAIFSEISKQNPTVAVVACNTVTAACVEYLREKYPFEIVGIQPAVKPAAADGGKCLVIATPSTASSLSLKLLIEKYGNGKTKVAACPDLAAYIEKNINSLSADDVKKFLPETEADEVVIGCTHYSFVKDIIKDYYNCPVYDGIEGTARRLCEKIGIFDHFASRAQKISFIGGDVVKNRNIFRGLVLMNGGFSQDNFTNSHKI